MKSNATKTAKMFGGVLGAAMLHGLVAAPAAHAAILAQYGFGVPPTPTLASSDTDPNSTASNFGNSPTIKTQFSDLGGDPIYSRAITFRNLPSTDVSSALALNTYFQFTVTPNDPTFAIRPDRLVFDTNVGFAPGSSGTFFVRSSADGFATTLSSFTQANGPVTQFVTRLTPLGSSFNTVGPLTFRIYEYDNSGSNSGGLRLDNVTLSGSVAPVPEVSTGMLMTLAMIGFGMISLLKSRKGTFSIKGLVPGRQVASESRI